MLNRQSIRRIAVFRALKLGDLLCATPAFRALRNTFPKAEITLIGLPWAAEFAERYSHYFDSFIPFPGFPGLPEQTVVPSEVTRFLGEAQSRRFDLAIQYHGSGAHVNELVSLLGATQTCGYYSSDEWIPNPELFIPYPQELSEIWRGLRLMQHLGCRMAGEELDFPLDDEDYSDLQELDKDGRLESRDYCVIHSGALSQNRLWPVSNFAVVASALHEKGFEIVLTGTEQERKRAEEIRARAGIYVHNVAGQTSLGCLGALIGEARLLVCHDTGVSHLAAALQSPSVVIFDRSEREGWPPHDRRLHRFLCRISGVTPAEVLKEACDLLGIETQPETASGDGQWPGLAF